MSARARSARNTLLLIRGDNMSDLIERQAAIDAINEIINRFEKILRDIRESKVDDSVCGMCEYDGAYIGQSSDWCNECPGFDKDDCFKLSDECRKRWLKSVNLPSAQPEPSQVARDIDGDTMWQSGCWVRYRAIEQIVKEQPTIEERKNGKWIRGDAEKLTGSQRCSICHKACYKGNDYFNFCPNCGADMRGET